MIERPNINSEGNKKDEMLESKKRPYSSEEEKLAEIRERANKGSKKSIDFSLHPKLIDDHKKKYRNE